MKSIRSLVLRVPVMTILSLSLAASVEAQVTTTVGPNPVTLTAGGGAQDVTVTSTGPASTTNPESINYSFSGFPGFIVISPAQQKPFQNPSGSGNYPPAVFQFSAAAGAS